MPFYRQRLAASLEESWVAPEPSELFQRSLHTFYDRFPLVLDDLQDLSFDRPIIAEGFGLLPELLAPFLAREFQAIWLFPTEAFKQASMDRRGKPSFQNRVRDPKKALRNLLARDRLLADHVRAQVVQKGLRSILIDGSLTADQVSDLVGEHFQFEQPPQEIDP